MVWHDELTTLLGSSKVSIQQPTLVEYSKDITENPEGMPDCVVFAECAEDVQKTLKFANERKIPVTPAVRGMNLGGLTIPKKGGIVLEMRRMNKIIRVNPDDMHMVIEPGVTWQQVKDHLDKNFPSLRFGYSLSPPDTSVMCNMLMDGLSTLALRNGTSSHWINGLEAVLADGTIFRTGIGAASENWCSRGPMPDLNGLFVCFFGSTGIVTKASVWLFPNKKFRRRFFILMKTYEDAVKMIQQMVHDEYCDDMGGISWPLGKMLFGERKEFWKDPNEPEIFVYCDISDNSEKIISEKESAIRRQAAAFSCEAVIEIERLLKLEPNFRQFSEFPIRLEFLLESGLTWVGTYGPISRWAEGMRACQKVFEANGFPPSILIRPLSGGHFGALRPLAVFDRNNPKEIERTRKLNYELAAAILPLGFFPYKTPLWFFQQHADKIDPNFHDVLARVKKTLDPNGIMNPGVWNL